MAIFLSLMRQIDFKLHILIVLNDLDKWVVIPPMLDQSKITKMHFLNDPKSQKWVFDRFLEFGALDRLYIEYFDRIKCLHDLASVSLMLDHSRITKMPF